MGCLPWAVERVAHWGVFIALGLIIGITAGVMYMRFYLVIAEPVSLYEQAFLWVEVSLLMWSYLTAVYTVPTKTSYHPTEEEVLRMHFQDTRSDIESGDPDSPNSSQAFALLGLGPTNTLKIQPSDVLQFCSLCDSYKMPRSHHCSKCGYCVNKMDHHCPWINTCVHADNHKAFCLFLFYVTCACSHGVKLCFPFYYSVFTRGKALRSWSYTISGIWCGAASLSLVVSMGVLMWEQRRVIRENATQVEDYIRCKADARRDLLNHRNEAEEQRARKQQQPGWRKHLPVPEFTYPYHLGVWRNFRQVFGDSIPMMFLPLKPSRTSGMHGMVDNNIYWEVAPGCGQFTLTIEQLSQKADKMKLLQVVQAVDSFSGSCCNWFCCAPALACKFGRKAVCKGPSIAEARLTVKAGVEYSVNRTREHWVYGHALPSTAKKPAAGWFPAKCVTHVRYEPYGHKVLTRAVGVYRLATGELLHIDGLRVRLEGSNEAFTFRKAEPKAEGTVPEGGTSGEGERTEAADGKGPGLELMGVPLAAVEFDSLQWATGQTWHRVSLTDAYGVPAEDLPSEGNGTEPIATKKQQ